MTDDIAKALKALAALLRKGGVPDAETRDAVAVIVCALAHEPGPQPTTALAEPIAVPAIESPPEPVPSPVPAADAHPSVNGTAAVPAPPRDPVVSLAGVHIEIGSRPAPSTPTTYFEGGRELELVPLGLLADRCRVKGDAARIVARRVADSFLPRDAAAEADAFGRADALPDCMLWMLTRDPIVTAPKAWHDLAGAYSTAADAALMLHAWHHAPPSLLERNAYRVLSLAAEAQSVLLYAVTDVRDVKVDFDQIQLFAHVRTVARDMQVFIPKFLKREDRADPASWPDVGRRVAEVTAELRAVGERDRSRHKVMNNLRFKLGRLHQQPEQHADEWPQVLKMIEDVVAGGLPPSNPDLRDWLLPVFEDIPDTVELGPNVTLVLRELDRYLDSRPDADPPPRVQRPSPDVAAVAELLRGREVVLIGGQARPNHQAALVRAFGLAGVRWIVTPEHTSFTVFEPDVARPEVAVVLLAIRWSSHDYDNVRQYCDAYGKPLVRLPGGYNANQVAHHIMSQAGERLREARAPIG